MTSQERELLELAITKAEKSIAQLIEDRQVTVEQLTAPMDAPVLLMKMREREVLTPEAMSALEECVTRAAAAIGKQMKGKEEC